MSVLLKVVAILMLLKTIAAFQLQSKLSLSRSLSLSWGLQPIFVAGSGQRRLLTVLKGSEAQELGEAIYDLQEMSSEDDEVLELVSALASKVQGCSEDFQAFDVSTAIYGLGRMNSNCVEVRELVLALVPKVQGCKEDFLARELGAALCGLSEMTSDSSEVRKLLSALVPKVMGCKEQLDSSKLDRSLQGLQGMSPDLPEVRELLSALRTKVDLKDDAILNVLLFYELNYELKAFNGYESHSGTQC